MALPARQGKACRARRRAGSNRLLPGTLARPGPARPAVLARHAADRHRHRLASSALRWRCLARTAAWPWCWRCIWRRCPHSVFLAFIAVWRTAAVQPGLLASLAQLGATLWLLAVTVLLSPRERRRHQPGSRSYSMKPVRRATRSQSRWSVALVSCGSSNRHCRCCVAACALTAEISAPPTPRPRMSDAANSILQIAIVDERPARPMIEEVDEADWLAPAEQRQKAFWLERPFGEQPLPGSNGIGLVERRLVEGEIGGSKLHQPGSLIGGLERADGQVRTSAYPWKGAISIGGS